MRVAYEPMFLAYRVNAVFVGHVHAYQRTQMVADYNVVDPSTGGGIWHFMVGTSGKGLYKIWQNETFPWVASRNATFWGPSFLYVPNATHARFTIHCARGDFYSCDGNPIVESFWFTNQLDVNPIPPPTASSTPTPEPSGDGRTWLEDELNAEEALAVGVGAGAVGVLGIAFLFPHMAAAYRHWRGLSTGLPAASPDDDRQRLLR